MMKKILLLTLSFVTLISPCAFAANSLLLPDNIEVVAINGEKLSASGSMQLADGLNQIALQYNGSFGRGLDAEPVQSEIIVALFAASNQQLRLSIPTIKKESQLESFNRNPQISISTASGEKIDVKTDVLKKDGIQIFRDYEQELVKFNKSDSPAAVAPTAQAAMPAVAATASTQGSADAAQMLIYWYQKADPATREMFKSWIEQQK
jgi:uncharacterized protein YccT (UPF0319 family)